MRVGFGFGFDIEEQLETLNKFACLMYVELGMGLFSLFPQGPLVSCPAVFQEFISNHHHHQAAARSS